MDVDIVQNKTLVCQCLREIIPSLRILSDERLEKRIGKEKFLCFTEDLIGYVLAGVNEDLSKLELSALTSQMLRCLGRYIVRDLNAPVTLTTMQNSIGVLGYAVDKDFPGYFGSRLLKYTILPKSS